jgi:hypothetical protein
VPGPRNLGLSVVKTINKDKGDVMRSYLGLGALGAGIGAGLMFLLDPQMGKRRRALLHDKTLSLTRHASAAIDRTARDLRNRSYGTLVSIRSGHIGQIRPTILNTNWPPAIRLIMGLSGGAVAALGAAKRGVVGSVLGGIGLASVVMAVTNFSVRETFNRLSTTSEKQTPGQQKGSTIKNFEAHIRHRNAG